MAAKTNYITGRTTDFDEFRCGTPILLEAGGFLICTSGSSDVVIDAKQYNIKEWDLVVAFPHSYAHAIHMSDDFDGVILGVDMDLLISTDIDNKSFYITSIADNPCISLQQEEATKILSLRESFLRESAKREHPLRGEIDDAMLKIIIYEIAALFHHSKPNTESKRTRDDVIFNNFILQLHSEAPVDRTLESFAQRQMITTSHLSKVIKRASGRTASQWISNLVVINIKRLLQNRKLSISSIADSLDFPNASFLTQYFKKHTAQTPKQYRAEFFASTLSQK
ncbi:MAG: helix-turn-helix transcriptional regulator [Rikenellaceae bacterium]